MQSISRSGNKWRKAVDKFWHRALDNMCEYCIRKMFRQMIQRDIHRAYMDEVRYIINNIEDDDAVWSTLLFDIEFAATLKARVQTWEPTMDMRLAPCPCNRYTRATNLQYQRPTLHQSTFVMPPRSLAGLGPNYQRWLDAPMNEPFPALKYNRQPPMLKYERQLAVDERYGFPHYLSFIRANPLVGYKGVNSFKIIFLFPFKLSIMSWSRVDRPMKRRRNCQKCYKRKRTIE